MAGPKCPEVYETCGLRNGLWRANPSPLRGGSAGIQHPGWPLLPQHTWRLRDLIKVLEATIRNLVTKEAS